MDTWIEKLRKLGVSIDEDGFLDMFSINASIEGKGRQNARGWSVVGEGSYGLALRNEDKILKIQKNIKRKDTFDKERVKNFQREVKTQQMIYDRTKTTKSLTPKIFAYGKNWVLMKNAPGKTIFDWFTTNRKGVFQKAMRAYIKALQTIHQKCGIAHFDAHGDNAIYNPETDTIKIIDWGKSVPVNRNNLTKEGMLKRYKERLSGKNWQWMADLRSSPLRQYAIEILPYNARFRSLKPDDNIFDFMEAILRNTNNFPVSPKTKNNNKAIENLKSTAIFNMAQDKIMKIQVKEGRMLTMNEQMNIHRKYKTLINEILKKSGKVMKMSELKSAVKARLTPSPKYNSSNK